MLPASISTVGKYAVPVNFRFFHLNESAPKLWVSFAKGSQSSFTKPPTVEAHPNLVVPWAATLNAPVCVSKTIVPSASILKAVPVSYISVSPLDPNLIFWLLSKDISSI